ncbi:hypothetical protein OIDMADRAFT_47908 [Oidiodendron maius Zn]|uniref:Uncharacterized protein n=1 Tax=Oidiodendron maius (strain Zn) TaxID=913774 RepID=A0A0C3D9L7_OIDMZ|nr:hypothetical protein OIDMADRAFT_47908 [Oidiodendron maius Zn]
MNVLEESVPCRYHYRRSVSGHQIAASSAYNKTESVSTETVRKPAQAAAALAFLRGQERSSFGLDPRTTRSSSNSQGGPHMSGQNSTIGSAMNALKRRQSVRFVTQRTTNYPSTQIFVEPRPGYGTVKLKAVSKNKLTVYRPMSPLSSFGNGSTASEVLDVFASGHVIPTESSTQEDDILSSESVHYGFRKSRSMLMQHKSPDVDDTNINPEKPSSLCYQYSSGISSIPMPGTESRQMHLKTHKSMSHLGSTQNNSSSGCRVANDLQVQIARDRFLHQMNQQRLRDRPSFLFWAKPRRQVLSGHSSSESSENEGIPPWKESRLSRKARRAANRIRNRFRRVFGRSLKAPVKILQQQAETPEAHAKEYFVTEVQEALGDNDTQSSSSISDTQTSLDSYKKRTIRLVPPTHCHLPIYQFSQDYGLQDLSYSESIYSRSTGSPTPEPTTSHGSLPNTSSAIHYRAQYDLSSTAHANNYSNKIGSVERGHIRENAQINDDDREVAPAPISMTKQPLGELQHNAMLNSDLIPVLKPTKKASSPTPLLENIEFNRSTPPLLPPRVEASAVHTQLVSSGTVTLTTLPQRQPLNSAAKVFRSASLADMILLSRHQNTSPKSFDQLPHNSARNFLRQGLRPSSEMGSESRGTKNASRSYERLWKLEPIQQTRRANESLRMMLVERGNNKRHNNWTESPTMPDKVTGIQTGRLGVTSEIDTIKSEGENEDPQGEGEIEGVCSIEGAGLMGPSIACRNIRLVGSMLSSRRSRIIGCSEGDSEEAFI